MDAINSKKLVMGIFILQVPLCFVPKTPGAAGLL
jgi:hypothetical protein